MRGKPVVVASRSSPFRIIPAHAGQTPCSDTGAPSGADHPRACGANIHDGHNASTVAGSSPRMRGKQGGGILMQIPSRIIPAHAGQTSLSA